MYLAGVFLVLKPVVQNRKEQAIKEQDKTLQNIISQSPDTLRLEKCPPNNIYCLGALPTALAVRKVNENKLYYKTENNIT